MDKKVLEIIVDGYGYDPYLELEILEDSFNALPKNLKAHFKQAICSNIPEELNSLSIKGLFKLLFNRNPLNLYYSLEKRIIELVSNTSKNRLHSLLNLIFEENHEFISSIERWIRGVARDKNYAVWSAFTPNIDQLRKQYPSISTKTSGVEVGFEDLEPEVQGNSETGHQQLGNMIVAAQIPLEIAIDIESGAFFENEVLKDAIETALLNKINLNITFMVSGEYGDDGRVHSCWNHLEAFLSLLFHQYHFDPNRLRIQAILDGRDAPLKSSVEKKGGKYGFLHKLYDLLQNYKAVESLTWIIGRGIAMDRDYEEERTRKDYELLIMGKGLIANNFSEALDLIRGSHKRGVFDPFIEPIVIRANDGSIRKLEPRDVVVDLNFRADRQRARIASLLEAKSFLQKEAGNKGKKWSLDWLQENLKLKIYCLTEYHPDFEKLGAKIAYSIGTHGHNFLSMFSHYFKQKEQHFRFLLMAESNKAVHVGYFIRGRREELRLKESENRIIIPSYAREDGIFTDDDFFKTPQMKAFEIAGKLLNELYSGRYNLAIVNLSNPDMLGHLINEHFDENVKALEVIDYIINFIVMFLLHKNYYIIITSDHGNVDLFSASHSLNNVITTFISPHNQLHLTKAADDRIRLFDIPWAIAEIFGITEEIKSMLPPIPNWISRKGLVGEAPIKLIND